MKKVTAIEQRKEEHIKINLDEDVRSGLSTGLERYMFIHEALPEMDLLKVDTSTNLITRRLNAPLLISSMTGGTKEGDQINMNLAVAAQEYKVALGLGSQRLALEHPSLVSSFSRIRNMAPDVLLFANVGAVQLNYGMTVDDCQRIVNDAQADALILHINPLQEALQVNGDVNFSGLATKIGRVCRKLHVPVVVKEVGWGISPRTAKLLIECGVTAIDVAGAGGTSWSQVEMQRAPDAYSRELASTFVSWGIPTVDSIRNIKLEYPDALIFASGGLVTGLDIAKCIALGARLGGMAGRFLKAASISSENVCNLLRLIINQLKTTMFACGAASLNQLTPDKLTSKSI